MKSTLLLLAFSALAPLTASAAYTYYYPAAPAGPDTLASIDTTKWQSNGTVSSTSGGYTSAGGGALVSKVATPTGAGYEVKMQLTLTASGGTYSALLRASNDAVLAGTHVGSYYGVDVDNPTFSCSSCSASLIFYKVVSGVETTLSSTSIACHSGMVVRAVMGSGNAFLAYVDNVSYGVTNDSDITSGAPGVAVAYAPAGNTITNVQLGPLDSTPPNTINAQTVGVSSFPTEADLQWQGVTDDPNGTGVWMYVVYRQDPLNQNYQRIANANEPDFSDQTVSPGVTYTYTLQACDWHWNCSSAVVTVNTPPANAIDPREIGVRPTGSYWGGGGENIDMLSGNLNFTVPLLKAMGRGGWSVGFNLCYNSQNWRQDSGGTWQLGRDEGYGYGWKLLAGSITPYYTSYFNLHHFLYTDSTGAEYRLDQNNGGGVWSSNNGIYVWYDSNTQILHFRDGSFWTMGSLSAGTEQDAGTMYPTVMEDTNGNQLS